MRPATAGTAAVAASLRQATPSVAATSSVKAIIAPSAWPLVRTTAIAATA